MASSNQSAVWPLNDAGQLMNNTSTKTTYLAFILGALQQLVAGGSGGGSVAPRTSNFQLLGASSNFTIPTTAKAWTMTLLTGTGTIGGKAVPAGFSDSSASAPAVGIVVTTDAASSAYIRYET